MSPPTGTARAPAYESLLQWTPHAPFASSNFRDGKPVGFEEVSRYADADLVTMFEHEHWETQVRGRDEPSPFDLRVTATFRREPTSLTAMSPGRYPPRPRAHAAMKLTCERRLALGGYFHLKWTKARPKVSEASSTR